MKVRLWMNVGEALDECRSGLGRMEIRLRMKIGQALNE